MPPKELPGTRVLDDLFNDVYLCFIRFVVMLAWVVIGCSLAFLMVGALVVIVFNWLCCCFCCCVAQSGWWDTP